MMPSSERTETPSHEASQTPSQRLIVVSNRLPVTVHRRGSRAADALIVTPLRDGMLSDALIVNPYDIDGVANAIHHALTLDGPERRRRMHRIRGHVVSHDVHTWASDFVAALRPDRVRNPD